MVFVARSSQVVLAVKSTPANAGNKIDSVSISRLGKFPGWRNGIHSSIPAKKIPWTVKPGRVQSIEVQRAGHNCVSEHVHVLVWGLNVASWSCFSLNYLAQSFCFPQWQLQDLFPEASSHCYFCHWLMRFVNKIILQMFFEVFSIFNRFSE